MLTHPHARFWWQPEFLFVLAETNSSVLDRI